MAGRVGRPTGYIVPEKEREIIRQKAIARHARYRELAPILDAIDAGDEKRALRLIRRMVRARKDEAA